MRSAGCRFHALLCCVAAFLGGGYASAASASDDVFGLGPAPDVAQAWLDLLFRGIRLPAGVAGDAPNLDVVAGALHRALGVYSMGILVLAGLLLFYNLAVMIIETAHYGVPLGRRSAQIWAPLRLVLAIGFLVPVSGGLNAGQYLVTWMAEQGSALASRAWSVAANDMKDSIGGMAMPQGPDVAGFVAAGLDMELCRSLYHRAFTSFAANPVVRMVGDIGEIEKSPPTRFAGETWQYSNRLNANVPLCGAWRFAASRTSAGDLTGAPTIDRLNNELADYSRTETDKLILETQGIADSNAGVFLGEAAGPGVHDDVAALIAAHKTDLAERLRALINDDAGLVNHIFTASADAGWIMAGGFLLELARLQEMYSTLAAHALPAAEVPVLAENDFRHPRLADAIATDPSLLALSAAETAPIITFYTQITRSVHLARPWIYDRQLADMPLMLADPFDLRDEMTGANDPAAMSSLFGHVLNDAAIATGVWNGRTAAAPASLFDADKPILALPPAIENPITALAEFGHRQVALGTYLFGIAGPDIAPAGALAHALLLGATGLGFMASGFALMFLVPLLPFIRFFIGILAWLLSVFEAVIAVPVVALAHINFTGEGLSGGAGRRAYLLWLNIIIRPALILFGLVMGLLLFTFAMAFLDLIFHQLMHLAAPVNGDGFVTVNVALTFLYTILAVGAANASFKGITFLPEMAIKWLGGFAAAERAEAPAAATANNPGVPGLPGLSPAALLAQRINDRARGGNENRLIAAAKSYGMALFPQYRGGEKSDSQTLKTDAGAGMQERTASSNEAARVAPVSIVQNLVMPRTGSKKNERRKGSKDNLTDDALSNLEHKTDVTEKAKPPEEPEPGTS